MAMACGERYALALSRDDFGISLSRLDLFGHDLFGKSLYTFPDHASDRQEDDG